MRLIIKTTFVLLVAILATNTLIIAEIAPPDFTLPPFPTIDVTATPDDNDGVDLDITVGVLPIINISITPPNPTQPNTSVTVDAAGRFRIPVHVNGPLPPGVYTVIVKEVITTTILNEDGDEVQIVLGFLTPRTTTFEIFP